MSWVQREDNDRKTLDDISKFVNKYWWGDNDDDENNNDDDHNKITYWWRRKHSYYLTFPLLPSNLADWNHPYCRFYSLGRPTSILRRTGLRRHRNACSKHPQHISLSFYSCGTSRCRYENLQPIFLTVAPQCVCPWNNRLESNSYPNLKVRE